MKKTYILILTLIVSLLPIMSLYSCESFESITKSTVVGEVMYVKASTYSLQEDSDITFLNYRLYIKPLGQSDDTEWIVFKLNKNSIMESTFSKNLEDMPELSIGETVKITFDIKPERTIGGNGKSYHIKSIKIADDDDAKINNPEFNLIYFKNHQSYFGSERYITEGEVIHVANANCPEGGYIVYIDFYEGESFLRRFWVNSETALDPMAEDLLMDGLIGHTVKINNFEAFPFYNRDIRSCFAMSVID